MASTSTPSQTEVLTAHIFQIFHDIRKLLVVEGGIGDLPLDFPIVEMDCTDDMSNFLGMCHFSVRAETAADLKKNTICQAVERVSMRVLCKPLESVASSQEYQHFHLLRLIPTLLHEFAHATTELGRTLSAEESTLRNRKLKRLEHSSHDDLFYGHFRRILKAAELLGIYSLPNTPNKYNCPSLRRFDQVDLEVCPLSLCGTSKIYAGSINVDNTSEVEMIPPPAPIVSISLTLINPKGVRKFVQLKDANYDALRTAAAKKYGTKATLKFMTLQGAEIDTSSFSSVKNGDTLNIA
jgi:hypothetical protein